MIDLRNKELPHSIECDGKEYEIDTDFRKWIEFERSLREERILILSIFKGDMPEGFGWLDAALEFLQSPNSTPNYPESSERDRAFDFVEDGAYIVAAFMQCYGIDLTNTEYMHWHLFKALFDGLSEDTKMSRIINYRTWEKNDTKVEEFYRKQKRAWQLMSKDERDMLAEAQRIAEALYEREMQNAE